MKFDVFIDLKQKFNSLFLRTVFSFTFVLPLLRVFCLHFLCRTIYFIWFDYLIINSHFAFSDERMSDFSDRDFESGWNSS